MKKNFVIINYNTPLFVNKLIMSINKFVKDAHIYVFDNSDKIPFNDSSAYNNVKLLDNTNSQYINFSDFFNLYLNHTRSHSRHNNYASVKHCYTIEKCIELFDENFILLDSDVLLKKDVSDLFDDKYIYVSEIQTYGKGLKRVLPYICYINVRMCKENNIHYCDPRYIAGLCYDSYSDAYDTGSGLYYNSLNLKHKEIKFNDYIVHYGHGSWLVNGQKKSISPEQFLESNKIYWS